FRSITFCCQDPATTEIDPLSLHDALPIFRRELAGYGGFRTNTIALELMQLLFLRTVEIRRGRWEHVHLDAAIWDIPPELMKKRRSEEHTSELQSRENLVCRLLLEKKKIRP